MTADKGFKRLVRQRMQANGLSYAAARQVLRTHHRSSRPMTTREEMNEVMSKIQSTIRERLAPVAAEHDKPLDPVLVSAVMFDREPGAGEEGSEHWVVHLYSLSPGLVVGRRGETAQALREELCTVAGDTDLRLNIVDFGKMHARRGELPG